jgi:hypothetical protein
LLRAVPPVHVKPDGTFKKDAFRDKTGLSVNLEAFSSVEETAVGREGFIVVRFAAGDCRRLNAPAVEVEHDPAEATETRAANYSHTLVVLAAPGSPDDRRLTNDQAKKLCEVVAKRV